jgi:hypothetical protein
VSSLSPTYMFTGSDGGNLPAARGVPGRDWRLRRQRRRGQLRTFHVDIAVAAGGSSGLNVWIGCSMTNKRRSGQQYSGSRNAGDHAIDHAIFAQQFLGVYYGVDRLGGAVTDIYLCAVQMPAFVLTSLAWQLRTLWSLFQCNHLTWVSSIRLPINFSPIKLWADKSPPRFALGYSATIHRANCAQQHRSCSLLPLCS